jgi:hypothetical protein
MPGEGGSASGGALHKRASGRARRRAARLRKPLKNREDCNIL